MYAMLEFGRFQPSKLVVDGNLHYTTYSYDMLGATDIVALIGTSVHKLIVPAPSFLSQYKDVFKTWLKTYRDDVLHF